MAFTGMNPDEGREIAQTITQAGTQTQELLDQLTSTIQGIDWQGPDADQYKTDWGSFTGGIVTTVADAYASKAQELTQHADEQDDTSNQS